MGGPAAGAAAPAHRARSGARTHTRGAAAARGEGRRAATEPREDLGVVRHRECDVEWCRPSLALCRLAASARPSGRGGQLTSSFRAGGRALGSTPAASSSSIPSLAKAPMFELVARVGASTRELCAAPSRPGTTRGVALARCHHRRVLSYPARGNATARACADGGARVEWEAAAQRLEGGREWGAAHARAVCECVWRRARGSCLLLPKGGARAAARAPRPHCGGGGDRGTARGRLAIARMGRCARAPARARQDAPPPGTARRAASSPSSSLRVRAAILDTRVV